MKFSLEIGAARDEMSTGVNELWSRLSTLVRPGGLSISLSCGVASVEAFVRILGYLDRGLLNRVARLHQTSLSNHHHLGAVLTPNWRKNRKHPRANCLVLPVALRCPKKLPHQVGRQQYEIRFSQARKLEAPPPNHSRL